MEEQKKPAHDHYYGKSYEASIIAEGVETEQQKVMLQGSAVSKAVGYFYARPKEESRIYRAAQKRKSRKLDVQKVE